MDRNVSAASGRQSQGSDRVSIGTAFPMMTDGIASHLETGGYEICCRHTDAASARKALFANPPQVALFDFDGEGASSLDLLRDAKAAYLPTRIILFAPSNDGDLPGDAVELGVDGLLLRSASADNVKQCVAAVASGRQWLDPLAMKAAYDRMARRAAIQPDPLTRRERDVARLVAAGQRNRAIAEQLGISEGTVKMHLHNVYAKLGLESRTQLAMEMRMREPA